jgi:hypothetical protein
VGQPVTIVVSGLPAVDLSATVGEQTRWIDSLRFDVSAPGGESTLEKELSMSVSPWEWRLRLTLTPAANGCYVVVCDWNEAPYGLALHRVDVGGTAPVPFDPDDPNQPPKPDPNQPSKILRLTYVYEKDQSSPPRPVASVLQQLNADGLVDAAEFEKDTVDGDGQVPDQFKVALEAAKKAGLPALVVEYEAGPPKVVKDPKTEADVRGALK